MAVSPSAHLPTTPNEHSAAAGHLGDGAEAAGAANEAVQPPDIAAELVCFSGIENNRPSADQSSTQTHPVVLPNPPNRRPIAACHLCDRMEAAAAASGAYLPPDTASEAATTLPPPPPSPETMAVALKAMANSSTVIPAAFQPRGGADVMATASVGPSQLVEEVLPGSQHHKNNEKAAITETACPSISNCNAEEGDERGTTERDPKTPSVSKATKKTQLR